MKTQHPISSPQRDGLLGQKQQLPSVPTSGTVNSVVFHVLFLKNLLLFFAAPMACGSSWVSSNPCHTSDPSCCSDNAGSLTHCNTTELFNVLFCAHFPPAAWNFLLLCLCVLEDHTVLGTQWAFAKYLWDCFEYKSTRNDDLIVSGACLMDHVLREAFA